MGKSKKSKLDWSKHASIRAPASVVKQLDDFKEKHGYTSRPQAIIAVLEKAEKCSAIDEIRVMLKEVKNKKISHVEIYYEDSSMEKVEQKTE